MGHQEQLREPERFEAWLSGICYHVCQRWNRAYYKHRQQCQQLVLPHTDITGSEIGQDFPDPDVFDPAEDLTRQDFALLLDRALNSLTPRDRSGLELYYLQERSQEDIAAQFGMTTGALKVQMHRARKNVWRLLHTTLRTEAEACGLILDDEEEISWRKASVWCPFCGQRTEGRFRDPTTGKDAFRLRCSTCEQKGGFRIVACDLPGLLDGVRSFLPAYKRVMQVIPRIFQPVIERGNGVCPFCQGRIYFCGTKPHADPAFSLHYVVLECSNCGVMTTSLSSLYANVRNFQQFMQQHPRYRITYTPFVNYDNQSAIRIEFVDILDSTKLLLFVHSRTLRLLGTE